MKQTRLYLKRTVSTTQCTMGVLSTFNNTLLYTLEPPFIPNAKQGANDCIPCGIYGLKVIHSPKFEREVIMLKNVPNNTAIEIHIGNDVSDTHGCILVGKDTLGCYLNHSRIALDELIAYVKKNKVNEIEITEDFNL